ncbi:MAG: VWA_CoxE family protein [Candidatus Thorarchaeota archaeon]|nr:MAG: VWA_CoxE family protein [Candidatus Thorarchaeota archaeon]
MMDERTFTVKRQIICWHLLSSTFKVDDDSPFSSFMKQILEELNLPEILLNPSISISAMLQRYPELQELFNLVLAPEEDSGKEIESLDYETQLRVFLIQAKALSNTLGSNTHTSTITASQFQQWSEDVEYLAALLNIPPDSLRGGHGTSGSESNYPSLEPVETQMIQRMALREILQDRELAEKLHPSMGLVEQLLRDKSHISGVALENAKSIIRRFVRELAEVLKLMVAQTPVGKIDYSVPPKRVYRNLDLRRTIWKNLPYYDPKSKKLYINHLFYHHTAKLKRPKRIIVVVDQSGSMVDSMVQCSILASIFAGVPNVAVELLAFDTRIIDLTPWVHDPFEALLRTQLGGGTNIYAALTEAASRVTNPKDTAIVLVTDFYEGGTSNVQLYDYIKSIIDSDINFIPVGAMTSSGYFSVNSWFRVRLKDIGHPILSGSPKKLIAELKQIIVT